MYIVIDFFINGNGDIVSGDDNVLIEWVNFEEGILIEEVGISGEEEDFGEFIVSDSVVIGNLFLMWMRWKEVVLFVFVGYYLF